MTREERLRIDCCVMDIGKELFEGRFEEGLEDIRRVILHFIILDISKRKDKRKYARKQLLEKVGSSLYYRALEVIREDDDTKKWLRYRLEDEPKICIDGVYIDLE